MLDVPRPRNFGGGIGAGASTHFTGDNGEAHYDHKFVQDITLSVKGKHSKSDLSDKVIYSYTPAESRRTVIPISVTAFVIIGLILMPEN